MRSSQDIAPDRPHSLDDADGELTLEQLLHVASAGRLTADCILDANGRAMTWQQLLKQLARTRIALRNVGLGPTARVAIALPNGPTLATVFLSIANCTGCAPLNTSYTAEEFEFYLRDLKADALITQKGAAPAAETVAAQLGIPVIECRDLGDMPGQFTLDTSCMGQQAAFGKPVPQTVALHLYTSGTTSRPKLVPLRHANLTASARNMVVALELTHADRCLNLMPLFHIHGLVGGLLAPLAGSGSTVCPPSLRPGHFFKWLDATRATWYTAVPTMHRMIVGEAEAQEDLIARRPLRFIRSSSAALPPSLFDRLVDTFGAPVLEAYSMTEAAHQMTCNPLGTKRQRPGTVGIPAGPEVAVMDEGGRLMPQGEEGEVVIRGPSVMSGYEANPEANASAFTNGWFRTGDQGRFDKDGYLVLTGRLKEQINRGGEKFAPLEVDEVLLTHPDVSEAVAFGFPHPTLGQEVAAAIVLRNGSQTTPASIQSFLREHLAAFKIPRRILLLEAIPKGPTGKIQRSLLHKQLPIQPYTQDNDVGQRVLSSLEHALLRLWRNILGSEEIGIDDDFFEQGGDSLMAVQMLMEVEKVIGVHVPESMLVDHPTVAQLASGLTQSGDTQARALIQLQSGTGRPPIFFFHGDYDGGFYTRRIARLLGPDQPFIAVAPHGLGAEPIPDTIEAMARDRLGLLLEAHPYGPFRLAGYCNGGMVALHIAQMLVEAGREVDAVFLIDTPTLNFRPLARRLFRFINNGLDAISPTWERRAPPVAAGLDLLWRQGANFQIYRRDPQLLHHLAARILRPARGAKFIRPDLAQLRNDIWRRERNLARTYNRLFRKYMPPPTDLPLVYFAAENDGQDLRHLVNNLEVVNVPGGHWGCITTHVDALAAELGTRLRALDGHTVSPPTASLD